MTLEEELDLGPDLVAEAQKKWELAILSRQETEALLFAKLKLENPDISATEIKYMIQAAPERSAAVELEVLAKSDYSRLYERHLSNKLKARLRVAM